MTNDGKLKKIALHGIVQNPIFVLVLGMCPTIKKTVNINDAFFLGVATLVVLTLNNVFISLLKKVIPDKIRLPIYIVIISSLVTTVEIFLRSELADRIVPGLYENLAEMISLIAVNCLILSRAESFASKNSVFHSLVDGLSMGIGFILALSIMAGMRQLLVFMGFSFFGTTAGGFMLLGLLMAAFNAVYEMLNYRAKRRALLGGGIN